MWSAVLTAASEKASLTTMLGSLHLVSLTPERAVVGHPPRDRLTAEMAMGHLVQLFERVLGRKVAVSIMQVKDAAAAPSAPPTSSAPSQPSRPAPASAAAHPAPFIPNTPAPAFTPRSAPSPAAPPPERATPVASVPSRALNPAEIDAAKAHPLVVRAGELLNAKVVRINARTDAPKAAQPPTP